MSKITKLTLSLEIGVRSTNEEWNKYLDCSLLINNMLDALSKDMKIPDDQVLEFVKVSKVETLWEE